MLEMLAPDLRSESTLTRDLNVCTTTEGIPNWCEARYPKLQIGLLVQKNLGSYHVKVHQDRHNTFLPRQKRIRTHH